MRVRNMFFSYGRNTIIPAFTSEERMGEEIMGKKTLNYIHARDIASLYSNSSMIDKFCRSIGFSNTEREEDMILETYSKAERINMDLIVTL